VDGPGAVRFDAALGRRELPHCSAVGKALLSALSPDKARSILTRGRLPMRTPHTNTDVPSLMAELALTARRGYAVDDEEDTEGVACIACCVFDRTGQAAGAISVTGLKQQRGWNTRREMLARAVGRHAARISRRLGGEA
jgi:IclR family acetate operon transcriptional repressor